MPIDNINKSAVSSISPIIPAGKNTANQAENQSTILCALSDVKQADADITREVKKQTPIDYNTYRSVKGFGSRVRFLVIHYTAAGFSSSINTLTGGNVSAHYLVPDPTERSYVQAGHKDMRIFNLVDEKERAWHAGISAWKGRTNINDTSIGIEIVNQAKDNGGGQFTFPAFNPQQVEAVKDLAANIIQRYPDITPTNVVGHSDISIGRKSDPGAAFPWQALYKEGIGAWYDESTKEKYVEQFKEGIPPRNELINKLKSYGYDVSKANTSVGFESLTRAFQLHFRQSDYSGMMDKETAAILYALTEKYA